MTDQTNNASVMPTDTTPADAAPPPRVFKIGSNRIVEDTTTAQLSTEQIRNLLKTQYPEVANATMRETVNDGVRTIEFLPIAGRKG